jgi:hypothetical protein
LVKSNTRRRQAWQQWSERMLNAQGAPCTTALDVKPDAPTCATTVRVFVWYQDSAIEGTNFPAMAGYSHGLYWVFRLGKKHLAVLHISALELLAVLANLLIFGNMMPTPKRPVSSFRILIQCDSLNATLDLTDKAKKSKLMCFIYDLVAARPEFIRLKSVLVVGHCWGEGNSITDDLSRGDMPHMLETCVMLGVSPTQVGIPSTLVLLVDQAIDYAISLGARCAH